MGPLGYNLWNSHEVHFFLSSSFAFLIYSLVSVHFFLDAFGGTQLMLVGVWLMLASIQPGGILFFIFLDAILLLERAINSTQQFCSFCKKTKQLLALLDHHIIRRKQSPECYYSTDVDWRSKKFNKFQLFKPERFFFFKKQGSRQSDWNGSPFHSI